jgi:hypothetical protein
MPRSERYGDWIIEQPGINLAYGIRLVIAITLLPLLLLPIIVLELNDPCEKFINWIERKLRLFSIWIISLLCKYNPKLAHRREDINAKNS